MKNNLKKKCTMGGIIVLFVGMSVVLSGCLMIHVYENFDDGIANDWDDDGGKWNVKMYTPTDGKYLWYPKANQYGTIPDESFCLYNGKPKNGFMNFSMELEGKYKHGNELNQTIGIVYRYHDSNNYGLFFVDFFSHRWYVYICNSGLNPPFQKVAQGYEYPLIDKHDNKIYVSASETKYGTSLNFYINDYPVYQYWENNLFKAGSLGIYAQGYTVDEVYVDEIRIYWDGILPPSANILNERELTNNNLQEFYKIVKDRLPILEKLISSRSIFNKIFDINYQVN
jgi:hypothetical protein